ncbi:MAG: DUF192 domain-containing protein [Dehalococcoidia bacterium]
MLPPLRRTRLSGLVLVTVFFIAGLMAVACAGAEPAAGPDGTPPVAETATPPSTSTPGTEPTATTGLPDATPSPTAVAQMTPKPTETIAISPQFTDHPDCEDIDRTPLPVVPVTIESGSVTATLIAEVAASDSQWLQGLMCRSVVPHGTGMLFPRPTPSTGGFWMFNTYVALDILYLEGDGRVVDFKTMTPCPRHDEETDEQWRARCSSESKAYAPRAQYVTVLELPSGWLESKGVVNVEQSRVRWQELE